MPTGYTYKLVEEGETFEEFAMRCARAFGALIRMREEPMDAPIPDTIEPNDYHMKELATAQELVATLEAMGPQERELYGENAKAEEIARYETLIEEARMKQSRLDQMQKLVEGWRVTKPLEDLREFMLDQLSRSAESTDYYENKLQALQSRPASVYHPKALEEAKESIVHHSREYERSVVSAAAATKWLRDLRECLHTNKETK